MPTLGEPGVPAPFGDQSRKESVGEAQRRLGLWWLSIWKIFGVKFDSRHEDAAAILAGPFIKRWPRLKGWKAPKNP